VLLATTCPLCGAPGRAPCSVCAAALEPAAPAPPPPGVDRCLALLAYEGPGAELVAGIKYRNHRSAVPGLARAMASQAAAVGGSRAVAVTWIPTPPSRRRRRGFDHGQVLATHVARSLGLPIARFLVRVEGPAQTGRGRAERLGGPLLAARGRPRELVLAVDDVVTTGATASAAARALRAAGAQEVWLLAAARRGAQGHYGA